MKLGTRVGLSLALLLLVTAALVAYQLTLTQRLLEANRQMAGADLEISRSGLRLQRQLDRLEDLTRRFLVLRDPAYVEELASVRDLTEQELLNLRSAAAGVDEAPALRALDISWRGYRDLAAELEAAIVARTAAPDTGNALLEAFAELRLIVARLDLDAVKRVSRRIASSSEAAAEARRVAFITGSIGLLLAAGLAIWIGRSISRPLRSLTLGARAMSQGDFTHRVTAGGPDEITSLARDFNDMACKLGELDQMKQDFLANVSHDLKAPLASIQEATRLLLEHQTDHLSSEQRHLLELNLQSAQRLEGMIADLLDVARLEAGSVEFQIESIDLGECCEQALEQSAGLLAAKDIDIERDGFDSPVRVDVDPLMLLRALSNLVSNATNFSPRGGTIGVDVRTVNDDGNDLETASDGQFALLRIADQGPGVPEHDKERIFDRFYRSAEHHRHTSGTGLGLAIARSIIEGHGGRIWVDDSESSGSVFTVLLPSSGQQRGLRIP